MLPGRIRLIDLDEFKKD
jgi:thiosulfate/3-mercaptopyruvate sulfurtransferase